MLVLITLAMVNQVIILIKESAVLSIITVAELTKNTTQFVNETYTIIEPYLEAVAQLGRFIERRVRF